FGSTGAMIAIDTSRRDEALKEELHTYQKGSITERQHQDLWNLIEKFRNRAATTFDKITGAKGLKIKIKTRGEPIKQPARRIPPGQIEWLKEEINRLEKARIIQRARGPWASPTVITRKKEIIIKETREREEIWV